MRRILTGIVVISQLLASSVAASEVNGVQIVVIPGALNVGLVLTIDGETFDIPIGSGIGIALAGAATAESEVTVMSADCHEILQFTAASGTSHEVHITPDLSATVIQRDEPWLDAGPALVRRTPLECEPELPPLAASREPLSMFAVLVVAAVGIALVVAAGLILLRRRSVG